MPTSKAQQRAVAKYMSANYDEIKVRVPKGRKAEIEAAVQAEGSSVNGLVNRLLREYLQKSEEEWSEKTPG